jgi:hypothetical protein
MPHRRPSPEHADVILVEDPTLAPGTFGMTYGDGCRIDFASDGVPVERIGEMPSQRNSVFPDAQLGEWLVAAIGPVASDHDAFALRLHACRLDGPVRERLAAATYAPEDRMFAEASVREASERMRTSPTEGVDMIALALWAEAGFPRVQMGHRLGASLLATHVPDEILEEVRPPWPAFQVDVPVGLLHRTVDGVDRAVTSVIVSCDDGRWAYFALREGGTAGFRRGMSAEQIVRELRPDDFDAEAPFPMLADSDQRLTALIGRLVVNVSLELSSPDREVRETGAGHGHWASRQRRGSPVPIGPRIYRLLRDVKVDVRAALLGYIRGGGQSPTVQVLVRGHWKHQAHGPGLTLRKRIHVEPYWRGPEDAPIGVRGHRLPTE